MNSQARLRSIRLGIAAGSALLACLLVELGLRLFHPVSLHPTDTFLVMRADSQDPEADKPSLVAGVAATYRTDEFAFAVSINSRGLREREIPYEKPAGVFRILLLGDSQTFGWGVAQERTYAKLLERELPGTEVINAAVPGMGTAHQLFFLEDEGWRYRPDAVVLGFFFNDVIDTARSPLYSLDGERLVRHAPRSRQRFPFPIARGETGGSRQFRATHPTAPAPVPQPSFWIRHSHLARLLRQGVSAIRKPPAEPPRFNWRSAADLTARVLEELDGQCRARGVTLLVVLLPAPQDCSQPASQSLRASNASVLRHLRDPDQEVLDMAPAFHREDCRSLFFPRDRHINAAGHKLIATAVAARLRQVDRRLAHSAVRPGGP